jgi:polyisoprenoid-binding protein YceI
MKLIKFISIAFFFLSMVGFSQNEPSLPTWTADVSHSNLGFKVRHKAISYTVGDFRDFDLTIQTPNGEGFENSAIKMIIETGSINTANASRDKHLCGPDFFDATAYPQIVFTSKKVRLKEGNTYEVLGELSMHGVTRELTLFMVHNGTVKNRRGNELAGLYFSTTFKRLDFGIGEEMSTAVVADEIELNAEIEIVKQ